VCNIRYLILDGVAADLGAVNPLEKFQITAEEKKLAIVQLLLTKELAVPGNGNEDRISVITKVQWAGDSDYTLASGTIQGPRSLETAPRLTQPLGNSSRTTSGCPNTYVPISIKCYYS